MENREDVQKLIGQVLGRCGSQSAEVLLLATDSSLTRFANNTIHQNVHERDATLHLRLLDDRRLGLASSNRLDPAGLDELVASARLFARASQQDAEFPGFVSDGNYPSVVSFDPAAAACSPQQRAAQVSVVCRLAAEKALNASGAYSTGREVTAIGNTNGAFAYHAASRVEFRTVVMGDDSSGHAESFSWRLEDIPVEALGCEAISKAELGRRPRKIEPGEYPVVLDPYATQDILGNLDLHGMGASAVQEGRSWMNDRLGEKAMDSRVSIWDDGLDLQGNPLPFDYEGTPKQRVDIVRQGVLVGPVYDRQTASKDGVESSGHTLLPKYRIHSPAATHLFMQTGEASLEDMLHGMQRGLYITRFWYTRLVHPRDCVITGMTRDGVFMVEDGELAYAVKNLRFTQSYLQALAEIEAIGRETRLLVETYGDIATRVPALQVRRFNFTGSTV
jgi:predicted Zn-dependent protease